MCRSCILLWVDQGNGAKKACPYCSQHLTNKDLDCYKDADDDKSGGGGHGGGLGEGLHGSPGIAIREDPPPQKNCVNLGIAQKERGDRNQG